MTPTRTLGLYGILILALAATPALGQTTKTKATAKAAEAGQVDLNSAPMKDLLTLPGIGEVTARKIIDGRPYRAVADLAAGGVPAATVARLRTLAVVKPLPPAVDVNVDTIDRLETLPGVTATLAREIVAARPLAGYESIAGLKGFKPEMVDGLKGRLKFGKMVAAAAPRGKAADVKKGAMPRTATASEKAAPASKAAVNINTADKDALDVLPGIGPIKAQAILDYRAAQKFETIEDVMKVKGIKEGEFARIKDMIKVR